MERDLTPIQGKYFLAFLLIDFPLLSLLPPSFFDIKHHVIFRLKVILPSLIWLIKVLLVVIQTEMQSPSGFFSRTVIILVFPNHMQKIWDSMARE
jgi:hypothetical protein